jgi:hypothetical protein
VGLLSAEQWRAVVHWEPSVLQQYCRLSLLLVQHLPCLPVWWLRLLQAYCQLLLLLPYQRPLSYMLQEHPLHWVLQVAQAQHTLRL